MRYLAFLFIMYIINKYECFELSLKINFEIVFYHGNILLLMRINYIYSLIISFQCCKNIENPRLTFSAEISTN